MEASIRGVFAAHFKTWAAERRLPLHHHKAAFALGHCRTSAMGTHVQRCEAGHYAAVLPNACRSRSCPRCAGLARERWVLAQQDKLLACDHYHVVFTLPHELLPLFERHRRVMVDVLFRSVRETLITLLQDPRHLGAEPGLLMALHTWGRNLSHHPHLHCLVTGGGLEGERWCPTKTPYLLPVRLVKALYRAKCLALLHDAVNRGELRPVGTETVQSLHRLLAGLKRVSWHVRLKERYAHGQGVTKYLARYVKGGPISDSRICTVNETSVRFRYHDHRDGKRKQLTLGVGDFLGRVLWHLPEPHQHVVRFAGLYASRAEAKRALARTALHQPPQTLRPVLSWQAYLARMGHAGASHCPICGGSLIVPARQRRDRNSYGPDHASAVFVQPGDGALIPCEPIPP